MLPNPNIRPNPANFKWDFRCIVTTVTHILTCSKKDFKRYSTTSTRSTGPQAQPYQYTIL